MGAKERICGHRSERRICCPKERSSPSHPNSAFPFIGEFLGKEGVSGRIYQLDDTRLQVLPKFEGSRNLMLTLPDDDGSSTSGLKWIMIWCNKFGVNLGHAILDVGDDSGD